MFDTLAAQIGAVFVVAVCLFAFLKGGETERIVAGAYVLGWFASLLMQNDTNLFSISWGLMAVDIAMLLFLAAMVWKSRASWPAWAAACQLLVVMSHFVSMSDLRPAMLNYISVINLAGYGVLLALAVGTFWSWQERRAAGLE